MSKLKVGIYGDSFAFPYNIVRGAAQHPGIHNVGNAWSAMLAESYDVENFSWPGSDIYFSYDLFLKNYKNFDVNIFVKTADNRLSVRYDNDYVHLYRMDWSIDSLKIEKDFDLQQIYRSGIDYFTFLQDDKKDAVLAELMAAQIQRLDPGCIFIDTRNESGLKNVFLLENTAWNIPTDRYITKFDKIIDLRYCHMTKENNIVVYDKVVNCIENRTTYTASLSDFKIPILNEKQKYIVNK